MERKDSHKSIKDQIVEKIKQTDNILERFCGIEFMIELCQVLKSLQFSPLLGQGQNLMYRNSSGFSPMHMIEQLNQANLIGILAESLNIMLPSEESLKASLEGPEALAEHFKKDNQSEVVDQLLERASERNQAVDEVS